MAIPEGTKTFNNFSSFIRAAGAELHPTVKIMLEKIGGMEEVDRELSLN